MRGILIDPTTKTVSAVDVAPGLDAIYKLIDADAFDAVRLPNTDVIYIDDEGLYREDQTYFAIPGAMQPFAGKGLVVGSTRDGDDADAKLTVEQVRAMVRFPNIEYAGDDLVPPNASMFHPLFGREVPVVGSMARFRPKVKT